MPISAITATNRGCEKGHRGRSITVIGDFVIYNGYGSMTEYMVRGMARAGARVNPWPVRFEPTSLSEEFMGLLAHASPSLKGPVLVTGNRLEWLGCLVGPELFVRQAWETSRFPDVSIARLNRCRAVIATTPFVADVLSRSGLQVPTEVVPDGVDPEVHHYEARPEREELTTLIVGRSSPHKHHPEAVAGWLQAFENNPTARLLIRSSEGPDEFPALPADCRIRLFRDADRRRGLMSMYRQADVLMALGNEGTGLPMLEAMASGLPVIALASEGQGDVCAAIPDAVLPVQPSRWEQCPPRNGHCHQGVRGVPDVAQVAAQLRWVAGHRDEAADMGRRAADWVRQHRNIWNYGPDVLTVVGDHCRRWT